MDFTVIIFYKFIHLDDPHTVARLQREKGQELKLTGRILLAHEGINATLEGSRDAIEAYKKFLKEDPFFSDIRIKESVGNGKAFPKLKVKVRDEVVTLGAGEFNVQEETAPELTSSELESWYANNEDFVVLDLRNDYEIASGKFDKTIDPGLANFRDLTTKLNENSPLLADLKNKKVVTVCTGGIRCEKATCLLKRAGFTDTYQLKDGIHTYMQQYPAHHFKGTLFVFDNRITTDVVSTPEKVVVGTCVYCSTPSEIYYADDRTRPSKKILCCEGCFAQHKHHLRNITTTCNEACSPAEL